MLYIVLPLVLFALSFISGMLGLGVAFVSTPELGLFGFDLKNVIMPWSLLLNGLTAIASILGAYLGGSFTAKRVKSRTLTRIFAAALVLLAIQRIFILLSA